MAASCVLAAALIATVGQPMNLALSGRALLGTLYIGILGSSCAYVLQQISIQRIGAGATGAFLNGSPVVSIFAAMVFMGEALSMIQAVCAAVIFVGIFLNAGGNKASGSVDLKTKRAS